MGEERTADLRGIVLDEQVTFTLREFCRACGVRSELVIEMIDEGVIEPQDGSESDFLFHGYTLVRAQRAIRLVRDLGVNWPGAALALDLLEEMERLERR